MQFRTQCGRALRRIVVALSCFGICSIFATQSGDGDTRKLFQQFSGEAFRALQKMPTGIERVIAEIDFCGIKTLDESNGPEARALSREVFSHIKRVDVSELDWGLLSFVESCLTLKMPELAEDTLALTNQLQSGSIAVEIASYYLEKRELGSFTNIYNRIQSWSERGNTEITIENLIRVATAAATNGQRTLARKIFDDAFRICVRTVHKDSSSVSETVQDLCSLAQQQEQLLFSERARKTIKYANTVFRKLSARERDIALSYLDDSTLHMGDIKDAERLLKYIPVDDRQSHLTRIAITDGCLGNVESALRRISKITDPQERDMAIAEIASCHAAAGKFKVAEMILLKVQDPEEKDKIRSKIATAYASQNDSQNATKWTDRIEDSDLRADTKERVASAPGHSLATLGPDARRPPQLFFCGTAAMQLKELRRELESNPETVAARLRELEQSGREETSVFRYLRGRLNGYLKI
jgi:hypothetical protein